MWSSFLIVYFCVTYACIIDYRAFACKERQYTPFWCRSNGCYRIHQFRFKLSRRLFTIAFETNLLYAKKVNRKVQEEPQTEVAANPWHQEEEKKWHRLTCAWLTNKCTITQKTSSLFPKQAGQNAKRTEETHKQRAGQDQAWSAS